jgi:hypothetical protein
MAAGTAYPDKYSALACRAGWETRASNHASELFGVDSKNLSDHSHLKVIYYDLEVGMSNHICGITHADFTRDEQLRARSFD